jgi:hypothetical protein
VNYWLTPVPFFKKKKDAFRTMTREEGFRSLYSGFVPALFGTAHGALQFMAYEEIRQLMIEQNGGTSNGLVCFVFFFFALNSLESGAKQKKSLHITFSPLGQPPRLLLLASLTRIKSSNRNSKLISFFFFFSLPRSFVLTFERKGQLTT